MLLKVMPEFHNKEPLSQYIASALMELGDSGHVAGIIKLISGISEELSYVPGMEMHMSYYAGIVTWDVDKDRTVEKANGLYMGGTLHMSCKIVEAVPHKLKCYYVTYQYVNSGGESKRGEAWVAEKDLVPQIKI